MIRGVIIGLFCVVLPTNLVFGAAGQQQNKKYGEKEVAEAKNTDEGRLQYDYDRDKPNKWKINGTFRYLYGQGRLEGKSLGKYFKEKLIMPTWRTRFYVSYKADEYWTINGAIEDNRVLNDHTQDDTVHWHRGYAEGNYPKTKILAGRFGYKLSRGNVMDTTADGIRLRFGESNNNVTVFGGRIGAEEARREGYILNAYK